LRQAPPGADTAFVNADVAPKPGDAAESCVAHMLATVDADPQAVAAWARAALRDGDADSSLGGQARHLLGMSECLLGRVAEGCAELDAATQTLRRHGPALAECRAWRDYGSVLTMLSGDVDAGVAALERSLSLAQELADPIEQGFTLSRLGPALGRIGRADEACRSLRSAVQLLAGGPDVPAYAGALDNLAYQLMQLGDHAQALPLLRAELPLRTPEGGRLRRINCEVNLAWALAGTGHADEAQALLAAMGPQLDPQTDGYQWADYLLTCGRVELLAGNARRAREALARALDVARAQALHTTEIDVLGQLSLAEERCGEHAAALACERALRQAERQWRDQQLAQRVRTLQAGIELAEKRAENQALQRARAELEQRVAERTAELSRQVRAVEAAREQARYASDHDWLTGLPNRRALQRLLADAWSQARTGHTLLGLLFVDLDGFKSLNDAHGHLVGDRLLRLSAKRLRRRAPASAQVTRFGGDEFVVLLPALADPAAARAVAQQLRESILEPFKLGERLCTLSCSIGIGVGPHTGQTPDELLRQADRAMLQAKAAGRNRVCELDAGERARLDRRGRLRRDLGHAIASGKLSAAFQPLWDVRRQRLWGVELLARWHDAELGPVSPAEFVPLAEESGLIGELGLWALRAAVHAAHALRAGSGAFAQAACGQGPAPRIGVNLSTVQLSSPSLVETLAGTVAAAGGRCDWIELELTESVQLAENADVQERLRQLREAGFGLAIDDFGAGYSSFSYLGRAWFDSLKIDRSLVSTAMRASDRQAVTGSIVAMAHRLGMRVVAEGVETAEQLALLAQQGCDVAQGYHIARPMPLGALLSWQPAATASQEPTGRGGRAASALASTR
jgi:diguanylate cyclase (GGDEF)-like protein